MKKTSLFRIFCLSFFLLAATVLRAYDGSVDRLLTGSLMCSGSANKAALAFDNDASTYYSASGSKMQWVGFDLGEPFVITRVSYTSARGSQYADRMLLSLFEGANSPDFMDAVPLYLISSTPANGKEITTDINVSRGFRYIRYVGIRELGDSYSPGFSYCHAAELKFYGHAGEGDNSQFYQITNLPTLSVHVQDDILPAETDKNNKKEYEAQSVLIYDGGKMLQEYPITFRVRGNYSATASENKAFRMKYNDGKSHHVMRGGKNESPAKAKKWVLINSYRDKTLMRNPVAWAMSKRAERSWTPWSQVVDLVVNGDYRGTYTLADAVTISKNRIDITEMTADDTEGEALTGGYFVELDNYYDQEPVHFKSSQGNKLSVHDPDEDIIQDAQIRYIKNTWNNMESVVFSSNYSDKEKGLRSVLDLESFLKWFLVSEFNGNTDMICQVFKFKERGDDHFYTGPVWDADLALENDETTYPANRRMDWTYKVRCSTGNWNQFLSRVLSDPSSFAELQGIWAKLRKKGAFNPDAVAADVDSLREEVRASARLNFIRWPYLTQYISLNPEVPGSWEEEVDRVRNYVYDRVAWMDEMLSYGRLRQENGIYQIASALDLCTFSQMVNEDGLTDASAVLTADIDMSNFSQDFQPIGTSVNSFAGKLDGQGHVISNLNITGEEAVGLFGYVSGCSISNIVFDATCSVTGQSKVGMLVGVVRNGTVTVSRIENHGSVSASGGVAAALVGYGNSSATIQVSSCCNTGNITAQYNAAALVGPSDGAMTVDGSYNIGTLKGATEGKDFAYAKKSLSLNNCWDYTSAQTQHMTVQQVASGYLCCQLNGSAGNGPWRQNIDNGKVRDSYPVLSKTSGKVYQVNGSYTNYNPDGKKYRYYNLVITRIKGGGCIQFSEFDILDESFNEVGDLVIYDGTSSVIGNEDWPNVADNNVRTKYCDSGFNGYAYFLFDAQTEVVPSGYRIYTANDTGNHSERNPVSWKLYGSNTELDDPEDEGWELLDERDNDRSLPADNYKPTDFFITEPTKSITLSQQSASLMKGEKLQLQVSYSPSNMQEQTLLWTSTNKSVATVDSKGLVEAVGLGSTDIIVTSQQDKTLCDTCAVVVVADRPQYRYFQFVIDKIQGEDVFQLSEISLLDANGNEIRPLDLYYYTGDYFSDESHDNLFDGSVYTKYCGEFDSDYPLYLFVDAGKKVSLSGYRFVTGNDTDYAPERNPYSWSLLGSNTCSSDWDDNCWKLLDRHEYDETMGAYSYKAYDFSIAYSDPIIIMAKDCTRQYGDSNPTFQYAVTGGEIQGTPQISCEATATSPVGEYPIVIKKGSVTTDVDSYVNGKLTITKAPLTVKADDISMEEASSMPELTLTYEGWKNGENVRALTQKPQASTTATSQSVPGEYPIVVTGGQAVNYYFIYQDGTFTVTISDALKAVQPADDKDVRYNLQGIRVGRNYKGMVIVNGKKISVK